MWTTSLCINVLLVPALEVLQATPQVRRIINWFRRQINSEEPTNLELLEKQVVQTQERVSSVLVSITVGMAFGTWGPILFFFIALLCPIRLFSLSLEQSLVRLQFGSLYDLTSGCASWSCLKMERVTRLSIVPPALLHVNKV